VQKRLFRSLVKNLTLPFALATSISYKPGIFIYRMTYAAYNSCFSAQFSFDLVTLTFNLFTLVVSDKLSFIRPMHIRIFFNLWLSVPELWVIQYDHITITRNGHCAYAMPRDLSPAAKITHFWNPWTQFVYSLCHFLGATTKIRLCYRR